MKRLESRLKELEKTSSPNAGPAPELTDAEREYFATHRPLIDRCNSGTATIAEQCELVAVLANKPAATPKAE